MFTFIHMIRHKGIYYNIGDVVRVELRTNLCHEGVIDNIKTNTVTLKMAVGGFKSINIKRIISIEKVG